MKMVIQPIDIGLIATYIIIVLGLGVWSARKQSPDEFLIHGRSLKTFPFIATVSASWVGGGANDSVVFFSLSCYTLTAHFSRGPL